MSTVNRKRDTWIALGVIGAVFVALTAYTWRRWPDVLVDFSAQLYFPWRISNGAVLYRDMAYLVGGPFSQNYHALLFKIFGPAFMDIALSNLVLAAVLLCLVYRLFYKSSDQMTAITIALALAMDFIFAHLNISGIFSYITPYCSEVVHGLILSAAAIALLTAWLKSGKWTPLAAAGFCAGLVFLTKPEVFLALAFVTAAAFLLFWAGHHDAKRTARAMAAMLAFAVVAILPFFIYFWRAWNFGGACRALVGGWAPILATKTSDNIYFRWCLGLDEPGMHLLYMLLQSLAVIAVVAMAAWAARHEKLARLAPFFGAILAALAWLFEWATCGQCLPVLCLALLIFLLRRAARSSPPDLPFFPILWTVFALGMMLKLGLNARIYHYGFVLGMPAFLAAIYLLLWELPKNIKGINSTAFRQMLWLPLMAGMIQLAYQGLIVYGWKTVPLGSGGDKIFVIDHSHRADDACIAAAMDWLKTNTPAQSTLAELPDNFMLNYLLRRINPCRYPIWAPPEVAAFGQDKMTADFIQHSPDYVVVLGMDYAVFGESYLGAKDRFGGALMRWIDQNYEQERLIGQDWMQTRRFGIRILKKRTAEPEKIQETAPRTDKS